MVVVVVGEDPYAEGSGDRDQLELSRRRPRAHRRRQAQRQAAGVVLLSGRPLILGDLVDRAGALVAAWLPGNRGRRDRRRARRRGQADRQAPLQLAARHGADPDQRRRHGVRAALPVRLRPLLVMAAPASRGDHARTAPRPRWPPPAPGAHERRPHDRHAERSRSPDPGRSAA